MKPATPLPWVSETAAYKYTAIRSPEYLTVCRTNASKRNIADAAYIVHACNNYPKVVDMLVDQFKAGALDFMEDAERLLRELGELE